jgi:hypothetical protein
MPLSLLLLDVSLAALGYGVGLARGREESSGFEYALATFILVSVASAAILGVGGRRFGPRCRGSRR